MRSRARIIVVCTVAVVLFSVLLAVRGYERTWRMWTIEPMTPHFADLRTITAGASVYARGGDPLVDNPGDPWHRRQNYPRIWQSLYGIGLGERHTTAVGIAFIALFLAGVCVVLPNADTKTVVAVGTALLSPATLLAVERGNTDLLMFFFVSVAVTTVERLPQLAAAALLAAFVLKLFPLLGSAMFLRLSPRAFFGYLLLVSIAAGVYLTLTYSDVLLVREATPAPYLGAYGADGAWEATRYAYPQLAGYVQVLCWLGVLIASGCALTALRRPGPPGCGDRSYINAFRAGSSIYIGTFVLANNFDYRLMFLILTVPQLLAWSTRARVPLPRRLSTIALAGTLLSMWYPLVLAAPLRLFPAGGKAAFALDELLNWSVFAALSYLLLWSAPGWIQSRRRLICAPQPARS